MSIWETIQAKRKENRENRLRKESERLDYDEAQLKKMEEYESKKRALEERRERIKKAKSESFKNSKVGKIVNALKDEVTKTGQQYNKNREGRNPLDEFGGSPGFGMGGATQNYNTYTPRTDLIGSYGEKKKRRAPPGLYDGRW